MKRCFDLVASLLVGVSVLPLVAVCALLSRISTGKSAFFLQERVGRGGRNFRIIKLRTMTGENDELRVTSIGRILRRCKLDELPQLANVIFGHMSLVGPRPELPTWVSHWTPDQRALLEVRPGLVDPASLAYADEERLLAESRGPRGALSRRHPPEEGKALTGIPRASQLAQRPGPDLSDSFRDSRSPTKRRRLKWTSSIYWAGRRSICFRLA